MRVFIDLDNTSWDLVTPWLKAYGKQTGDWVKSEDITNYNIGRFVKRPEELFSILSYTEFWKGFATFSRRQRQLLKEWKEEHSVYLVSHTTYDSEKLFKQTLANAVSVPILFMSAEDRHLLAQPGTILLDDHPTAIRHFAMNGGAVACVKQHYNKGIDDMFCVGSNADYDKAWQAFGERLKKEGCWIPRHNEIVA